VQAVEDRSRANHHGTRSSSDCRSHM
jgi:hypothetical protein